MARQEILHQREEPLSRPCDGRHSWGRVPAFCRKTLRDARSGIYRNARAGTRVRGDRIASDKEPGIWQSRFGLSSVLGWQTLL